MITCELYMFQKRRNSTKTPSFSPNTVMNGEIKHSFSPSALMIKFDFGAVLAPPVYNYAHIPLFNDRYYYITDWNYAEGMWIASLVVDVLATYKLSIGSSTQYVSRAYSQWDPGLIDTTYSTTNENMLRDSRIMSAPDFWGANVQGSNGLVVIGTVGATSYNLGATTYYAMSMATARAFLNSLLSGIAWAGINVTEISQELQKALINPMQYIVSAKWFPINADSFVQGAATTSISLGYWSFNLSGTAHILNTVSASMVSRQSELQIPKNPQSLGGGATAARLQYLNLSPFAEYTFKFLPFGIFTLDGTDLFNQEYLGIKVDANLITGDAILKLAVRDFDSGYAFESRPILNYQGAIGVELPVAQITMDAGKWKNALAAGGFSAIGTLAGMFGV